MNKFTYRPEIDGLRAVAVLLVLFFHAKLGFPGGYVGVDVFFVISGYLITGIIVKAQEENKFSLANFWTRRLRRILPAAAVVVAFNLLAGCFLLTPKDLYELGVSAIWQQAMLSNVYFWKHTGYFAGSADLMPLLHTWSLAVEEQFYLGYPFLLILGRKWKKKNLGLMLSLLMIFSFSISVWGVENYPVPAFFLLPSRMWELLIGGLLVLLPAKQAGKALWRESMAWTGVAAIVVPGLYYNAYMPFPGIAALPPCLGAACIIYANTGNLTQVGQILSNKYCVFIGLISYSLYLWHFPLLAYCQYWFGEEMPIYVPLTALAICFVLSCLSWKYIESSFRMNDSSKPMRLRTAIQAAGSVGFLIIVSSVIVQTKGLPERIPEKVRALVQIDESMDRYRTPTSQVKNRKLLTLGGSTDGSATSPQVLIWGDSHGMAIADFLSQLFTEQKLTGKIACLNSTPPLLNAWTRQTSSYANVWNQAVLEYAKEQNVKNIIIIGKWSYYVRSKEHEANASYLIDGQSQQTSLSESQAAFERSLERTFTELSELGCRVWIMAQVPLQKVARPDLLAIRSVLLNVDIPPGTSLEQHREQNENANRVMREVAGRYDNVEVLDASEYFFGEKSYSQVASETQVYYQDRNHLTYAGADRFLRPMFLPVLESVRSQGADEPWVPN